MKRNIKILLFSLFTLFAVVFVARIDIFSNKEAADNYEVGLGVKKLYDKFLYGDGEVIFKDKKYSINELMNEYITEPNELCYASFDMNGDTIPELHLKSPRFYLILTAANEGLTVWHEDSVYTQPLNNRAILYERSGGGPEHISYQYSVLDFYGEVLLEISFEKYSPNDDGIYQENSDYFFEGLKLSKKDWDALTKKYLAIGCDQIKWYEYDANTALKQSPDA